MFEPLFNVGSTRANTSSGRFKLVIDNIGTRQLQKDMNTIKGNIRLRERKNDM